MKDTVELSPNENRLIGYKVLFAVAPDSPQELVQRVDPLSVGLSPDVVQLEEEAAQRRWELAKPFRPWIEAAASWMTEVIADDLITNDASPEEIEQMRESIQEEQGHDVAMFGAALLGILLEEGVIKAA